MLGHRSHFVSSEAVLLRGWLLRAGVQQEKPQQGEGAAGGTLHQEGPQREADHLLADPEGGPGGGDGAPVERNLLGGSRLATKGPDCVLQEVPSLGRSGAGREVDRLWRVRRALSLASTGAGAAEGGSGKEGGEEDDNLD